jgi:hypothetical protein
VEQVDSECCSCRELVLLVTRNIGGRALEKFARTRVCTSVFCTKENGRDQRPFESLRLNFGYGSLAGKGNCVPAVTSNRVGFKVTDASGL